MFPSGHPPAEPQHTSEHREALTVLLGYWIRHLCWETPENFPVPSSPTVSPQEGALERIGHVCLQLSPLCTESESFKYEESFDY